MTLANTREKRLKDYECVFIFSHVHHAVGHILSLFKDYQTVEYPVK